LLLENRKLAKLFEVLFKLVLVYLHLFYSRYHVLLYQLQLVYFLQKPDFGRKTVKKHKFEASDKPVSSKSITFYLCKTCNGNIAL